MTTTEKWYADFANVSELGAALVADSCITTCDELLRFFEKPSKWTDEYARLRAGLPLDGSDDGESDPEKFPME